MPDATVMPTTGRICARETMLFVTERGMSGREAEQLRNADLAYREVGSTRGDTMPNGYDHLRRSRKIGAGTACFEVAARVLLSWDMHRRAGLRVRTSSDQVAE